MEARLGCLLPCPPRLRVSPSSNPPGPPEACVLACRKSPKSRRRGIFGGAVEHAQQHVRVGHGQRAPVVGGPRQRQHRHPELVKQPEVVARAVGCVEVEVKGFQPPGVAALHELREKVGVRAGPGWGGGRRGHDGRRQSALNAGVPAATARTHAARRRRALHSRTHTRARTHARTQHTHTHTHTHATHTHTTHTHTHREIIASPRPPELQWCLKLSATTTALPSNVSLQ